jgi:hydroxymethylbilane synthase
MPRIVLGNRGGTLELARVRTVLAELSETWPDISIVQRTVAGAATRGAHERTSELLDALVANRINIAVQRLDTLPVTLPDGLVLSAVGRRLEGRTALIAATYPSLEALPPGAKVGVVSRHDRAFVRALRPDLEPEVVVGTTADLLAGVLHSERSAALMSAAELVAGGWRERIRALLEPEQLPPPAGQGTLGFVVREDDDLAAELAYTLQHRPSYDRARAERAFAGALGGAAEDAEIGAFASLSADGELTLLGALASHDGTLTLQAEGTGAASEAEEVGRKLAHSLLEQLSVQR